jgi:hypothetical protein
MSDWCGPDSCLGKALGYFSGIYLCLWKVTQQYILDLNIYKSILSLALSNELVEYSMLMGSHPLLYIQN